MSHDQPYRNFVGHLAQVIAEHMPWPYADVDRSSREAHEAADVIARESAPALWAKMQPGEDA